MASLVLAGLPFCGHQDATCSEAIVPVSVVFPDQRHARGLTAEHFVARLQGKPADFEAGPDNGPRRILLLIDVSKKMNDDIWRAALAAATSVAERARSEDQIGLLTFGGPRIFLGWNEPRSAVLETLASLSGKRPVPAKGEVLVRDALSEALGLFSPPHFGDAVYLLFSGEDTGSSVSMERLRRAYSQSHVRILGMVFGVLYRGTYSVAPGPTGLPEARVDHGNPFYDMVADSGGVIMIGYSGHPHRSFNLTPDLLEQLRTTAWRLYGQIVEIYKIKIVLPSPEKAARWELELSPETKKKYPGLLIRKPHLTGSCWAN
jgi:hypothetical protein